MIPNYRNKYKGESILIPDREGDKKERYKNIPKKCIILYQEQPFNYLKQKYKSEIKLIDIFSWGCEAYSTKEFCFIRMKGVGSPHVVAIFEEFIALGITEFLNIGIAGGLSDFGIFLCDKSLRDEGTSQHYFPTSKWSFPDKKLTIRFRDSLLKRNICFSLAFNWTTDAPFRETKEEVYYYKDNGIKTVDMETSALFSVAKYRNVKMVSVLVVSEILNPLCTESANVLEESLIRVVDVGIECLKEIQNE